MAQEGLIAVDMGGTFLKYAVVVSGEDDHATLAATFARSKISDTADRPVSDVLVGALDRALDAAASRSVAVTGIGVCSPGPFDWERGISRMTHKFLSIRGIDLRQRVRDMLPRAAPLPMGFVPDSYAFAAGERVFGMVQECERCLYITLGTGIGSALSAGRRIFLRLRGASPDGSIWDAPYRGGITEDFVSARAVIAAYRRFGGGEGDREIDVSTIAERARGGDAAALGALREFGRHLGAALKSYAGGFMPHCIVLGGGLASCFPLFEEQMREGLADMPGTCRVVVSRLGDKGPLLGVAATFAAGYHED